MEMMKRLKRGAREALLWGSVALGGGAVGAVAVDQATKPVAGSEVAGKPTLEKLVQEEAELQAQIRELTTEQNRAERELGGIEKYGGDKQRAGGLRVALQEIDGYLRNIREKLKKNRYEQAALKRPIAKK